MRNIIIGAVAALTLTGCAAETAEPTVTETVTQEQATETVTTPSPTADVDTQRGIMEISWEQLSQEQKESICFGWGYDEELMVETFMETSTEIDEGVVRTFIDGKCS